jgi:hypothetical protein
LLIEESRTNSLTYSEEFDNAYWTKFNTLITANAAVAPDGKLTADKLTETANDATHFVFSPPGLMTAGTRYTYSVYAKAAERSYLLISPGGGWGYGWFNLQNGTLGTLVDGGSSAYASIESAGNGWYRCSITATAVDNKGVNFYVASADNVVKYLGAIDSGIYLWGAQLEAGAFPTSYIPTTGTALTRSADNASISGSDFSSWYNQSEGTVFADASAANAAGNQYLFHTYGASANNNRSAYYLNSSNRPSAAWINSGTTQALLQSATPVSGFEGAAFKYVAAYNTNDFVVGYNGGSLISLTSGTPDPTINLARIGSFAGTIYFLNGTIARLTYFPERLPDSTLQAITQ